MECEGESCNRVESLLDWFTEQQAATQACLKYLLTYREFQEGTTGLGWKGSICARKLRTRSIAPRNTGVVTLLNNNQTRTILQAARTLAHEVGHNFGANHDEDTPCIEGGGGRLMAAMEEEGERADTFSNCASQCIRENIRAAVEVDRARVARCPSSVELLWEGRREYCFTHIRTSHTKTKSSSRVP